jgi:hypothetical protein
LTPLLELSRATGAALLLLHHGSAHATREGSDAVLNSTAISGSVDNVMVLKRADQLRTIATIQRIGIWCRRSRRWIPMPGDSAPAGNKQQARRCGARRNLLAVLKTANVAALKRPSRRDWPAKTRHGAGAAFSRGCASGRAIRRRRKGDPYVYRLVEDATSNAQMLVHGSS